MKIQLKYKTVDFIKVKKQIIHDQYHCMIKQPKFTCKIGIIMWNEFTKQYGFLTTVGHVYSQEQWQEILEFLNQLNES